MRKIALFILLAGTLAGCGPTPMYEKVYRFEGDKWEQKVKPVFKVDVKDISTEYDFVLTLRTTTDYEFNNLWVYLNTITPSGQKGREPFEIKISNPDGTWAGKKTGTVVEFPLYFKRRKLPEKGTYTFVLEQAITASTIDEVLDIGFKIKKVAAQ